MSELASYQRVAAAVAGVPVGEFVEPSQGRVDCGPVSLSFLDWGGPPGRTTTIIFLHGGCLTAHTWDLVCLALRAQYRCVALDLRGHGESAWADDYSLDAHVGDVERMVRTLGLDKPVVVGMSLGGLVGLEYASRHDLAGLVVVDVGPSVRIDSEEGRRLRQFVQTELAASTVEEVLERVMQYRPDRRPELLRHSLLHNLRRGTDGLWRWKYDPRLPRRADPERLAGQFGALREHLKAIQCPTLVVRGAHSELFTAEDAEDLVGELADGRWVEVEGASHTVQGENPAGLLRHLDAFLAPILGTGAEVRGGNEAARWLPAGASSEGDC